MSDHGGDDIPLAQPLTPREQDVLNGLGDGLTNRQIAAQLSFALSTVKWYVRQIYGKLGVANRQEALARAQRLGLLAGKEKAGAIRHNLPAAATPFVGRGQALQALGELLEDSTVRLITVVGPGGIGKTRLALEAGRRQLHPQSRYRHGVFFVSLAPVESAAAIVPALAAVLAFQFQGSHSESEQLLNYLASRQMLLVLDNFEHLLAGRPFLVDIGRRAAGVKMLVTSRERLQLQSEQLFPLQGLATAPTGEAVEEAPAAQLFLNIARRTVPDFQLLAKDAGPLRRICQLVGGMPLALELAASWVGLLPLTEIAAELEHSLQLLATEHHDVPPRHRSMQAALDASWRQLNPEHQLAFQKLTVFRGGLTRPAALAVAGATLPLLATLVNKSWLTYDRQNDRYYFHELLRQYGADKLAADAAGEVVVREKHSAYFCGYLKSREGEWFTAGEPEAIMAIGHEIDNIQQAWRWSANHGAYDLLAQGLESLCRFYDMQGQLKNGQQACRLADRGLSGRSADEQCEAAERWAFRSQILAWESGFEEEVSRQAKCIDQSQACLERATKDGGDRRLERAFFHLKKGQITVKKDFATAIDHVNLGLLLFRELKCRGGEIEALTLLGGVHLNQGELDLAADLMRRGLELCQQLDYGSGTAEFNARYSQYARYRGHFEESETRLKQSIRLARHLRNRHREIRYLVILSFTQSWAGKFTAARKNAAEAIKLDQILNQKPDSSLLNALLKSSFHLGHYAEAEATGQEALEQARQRDHLDDAGWATMFLGNIALARGDLIDAETRLLASIHYLAELKHTYRNIPQAILSYVQRAQGNGQLARQCLIEPLRSGIEQRSVSPLMKVLPAAALLAADDGRAERALELYGVAQQFGHITHSRWFKEVACRELDGVRRALPLEVAAAAEARGQASALWETAAQLLSELSD